jgi:acyl-coenzyme A synthetase/AMP-(fatty) acid ligase
MNLPSTAMKLHENVVGEFFKKFGIELTVAVGSYLKPAQSKVPKDFEYVNQLPKTVSGKIKR